MKKLLNGVRKNGIHLMLAYPMVIKEDDYPSLKAAMDSLQNKIKNRRNVK